MCVANRIVAFDESGNTGQNLLDRSQPVFVLASVHLSHKEAKTLHGIVSSGQEKEIHFTNLKRSESGKQRIKQFLQSPLLIQDRVKFFVAHKSFMVTSKIVDLLVETLAFRDGIDIYKKGTNIAMANLYHLITPVLCGKERFARFQSAFVQMIRMRDNLSIDAFYSSIQELRDFCRDEEFKDMLNTLTATRAILNDVIPYVNVTTLDPSIPLFFYLCAAWGEQFGSGYDLVYDQSKPIANDHEILEFLMCPNIPEMRVGYDRRKVTVPLKATGITFVDSRDVIRVQIADLLAGTCGYWAGKLAGLRGKNDLFRAIR